MDIMTDSEAHSDEPKHNLCNPVDGKYTKHQLSPTRASVSAQWDMNRHLLDRMAEPVVREALDLLAAELCAKHNAVRAMLNRMDRNKDGILSRDEICCGLAEMVQLSQPELDSAMRAFDKDRNGTIDSLEFYTVLTKHRGESSSHAGGANSADAIDEPVPR